MRSKGGVEILLGLVIVLVFTSVQLEAQLKVGFYNSTCRFAESIVRDEVRRAFLRDKGVAAGLLRMHFHDCFVRGCESSVLIDSTPSNTAEKDSVANNPSLRGFEVIDKVKARLETVCRGVVSCADILAFAARDSIVLSAGFGYNLPAGRRDGRISTAPESLANLPPPSFNLDQLTQNFANKGLTQEDMVTLSGAHTIGRSHCTSFSNRLYNFSGTTSQDPSLDPTYAAQLKQQCPPGNDPNLVVPMNRLSPNTLGVGYYRDIVRNRGLFTSDQALLTSTAVASQVNLNARSPLLWRKKFADAMVKMGNIGVLTGTDGEIRLKCRVINQR